MSESLLPNSIISHYRIVSRIGAGGMGEVYLAQDTSALGRAVALKIVPAEVAQNKDRLQRFTQEARTLSNLNHPNILTVYEFGQSDTASFIATEYIDGVTLRQHLSSRRLKLIGVLDVTIQIVAALNAAHEAGITHRDLKPENVMIRKDHIVKVLDFGLAKLSEPSSLAGGPDKSDAGEDPTKVFVQTEPGLVMGTVRYMSPEQSVGKGVDQRTDIWSIGVLLYEMLAGCVPFQGKDIHRQIIAIQETEPAPLSQLVEGVPDRLEEIVFKCLAKEKDERYQSAKDLLIDLRNLRRRLEVDAEIERSVTPGLRSTSGGTGTALVSDSSSLGGEAGTASGSAPVTTEIATTLLPPATDAGMNHPIAPATVPPADPPSRVMRELANPKRGRVVIPGVLLIAAVLTATAYFYLTRKDKTPIQSIAVMPFVNESGNADVDYLSDGMTETLIASLSQLPNLSVKARSTVFYYKGKETSPKKIGAELDVQAVLLGRVAQRGSDIKLNLELVNTTTQDVIWSEQYNRKQSDLLRLQGEIARDVSSKLQTKLSGAEVAKLTKTYTANPAAYELYLKGKYYANRYTKEGLGQSIDCFDQAIAIDPNYSSAYSGLAYTYILMDDWFMSPNQSAPKAREAARKALEINESDVDAHVVLGLVAHWYDWDWAVAEKELKRSLELNPRNPESYLYYSYLLSPMGRPAEAESIARQGLQIDPLSSGTNFGVASALVFNRRWDDAIVHLRKAIELEPNYWLHHSYLGRAYEHKGMMPEAIAEFKLAFALDKQQSENWAGLANAYAVSGRKDEAQKMLDDLMRKSSENTYVSPYSVAVIYAGLGNKDKTFEWLERAYSDRSYYLPVYLTTDERLDAFHSDPRYKDLVRRIGLPELK